MHKEGHLGLALVWYAPIAYVLSIHQLPDVLGLGLVGILFWSLAPDIDHTVRGLSHRGLTHTVLAAGVAGLVTALLATGLVWSGLGGESVLGVPSKPYTFPGAAGFGFLVGMLGVLSHLIGDVVTPMGIRPFEPFSDTEYSLYLVASNDRRVNGLLTLVGGAAMLGALVIADAGLIH